MQQRQWPGNWSGANRGDVSAAVVQFWLARRPPIRSGRLGNLTYNAERRIGPRDDDVVGFHKTLREADRAPGFDHFRFDGELLSDLSAADEIPRETGCHQLGHP